MNFYYLYCLAIDAIKAVRMNAPAKRVAIPYTEKNAATRAMATAVSPSRLSNRMNRLSEIPLSIIVYSY